MPKCVHAGKMTKEQPFAPKFFEISHIDDMRLSTSSSSSSLESFVLVNKKNYP